MTFPSLRSSFALSVGVLKTIGDRHDKLHLELEGTLSDAYFGLGRCHREERGFAASSPHKISQPDAANPPFIRNTICRKSFDNGWSNSSTRGEILQ